MGQSQADSTVEFTTKRTHILKNKIDNNNYKKSKTKQKNLYTAKEILYSLDVSFRELESYWPFNKPSKSVTF